MPKRILVVDDDEDLRDLVCFVFENAGFVVNTAVDGDDALAKARVLLPDLILLDVMMPDVDGFTVCEILRRNPATADIPIILLTALGSQLSRIRGMELGATDYFSKPFSSQKLLARVEDLLREKAPVA